MLEKVRNGEWLRARVAAVETGIDSSFKELHDKLALDKATARYVKESDEETSRTVEMYDMVSLVSTRSSRLSAQREACNGEERETAKADGDLTQNNDESEAEGNAIAAREEKDEEVTSRQNRS